jgi:uncharacterized membrane protein required for colicin V production
MNGIIVDVIVVLVIILFAIIGYFKGFLRELVSLLGFVGSLIITYFAYTYFADFLNQFFGWGAKIANYVAQQVGTISSALTTDVGTNAQELQAIINNANIGIAYKELLKKIVEFATFGPEPVTVAKTVGLVVSNLAMMVISFALLFVLLRLVVFVLDKLLSRIPRKSAVGVVNKWLGLGVGIFKGVVAVGIILITTYLLCMIPSVNDFIMPYINSSYATKYAYEYLGNLLLGISIL